MFIGIRAADAMARAWVALFLGKMRRAANYVRKIWPRPHRNGSSLRKYGT